MMPAEVVSTMNLQKNESISEVEKKPQSHTILQQKQKKRKTFTPLKANQHYWELVNIKRSEWVCGAAAFNSIARVVKNQSKPFYQPTKST